MRTFIEWLETQPIDEGVRNWLAGAALTAGSLLGGKMPAQAQTVPNAPGMYEPAEQITILSGSYKDSTGQRYDTSIKEVGPNTVIVPVIVDLPQSNFQKTFHKDNGALQAKQELMQALRRSDLTIRGMMLDRKIPVPGDKVEIRYYRMQIEPGGTEARTDVGNPDQFIPDR